MTTDRRHDALGRLYHRLSALGAIYWHGHRPGDWGENDKEIREWAWEEAVQALRACALARPSISHLATIDTRGDWHKSDIDRLFLAAGLKTLPPAPPLADQLLALVRSAEQQGTPAGDIRRALREATKRWSEQATPCLAAQHSGVLRLEPTAQMLRQELLGLLVIP